MKMLKKVMGTVAVATALTVGLEAQATTLDLQTANATGQILGATYTQVAAQPTGSGVIDSFVRIRDNQAVVQGYNTTVNNTYQNDGSNTFNHEVTVGQVGFIDINGAAAGGVVMRFLLDINQQKSSPYLALNEVQIYLSKDPNQSIEPVLLQGGLIPFTNSALVYQMDGMVAQVQQDNSVDLNYALNGGSGSGDMTLDIPIEMFNSAFGALGLNDAAAKNGAYIYLYSHFSSNNDGYEEWAHFEGNPLGEEPCNPQIEDCGPREIPEPNSLILFSLGLIGSVIAIKRGRQRWLR